MEYNVKDLMAPISEYATVPEGSSLMDAVRALAKAQSQIETNNFRHRAVLVTGEGGRVVGKLNQLTVLHALEFGHKQRKNFVNIDGFGFSSQFITSVREKSKHRETSLEKTCSRIIHMKVEDLMETTSSGEYVDETTSLENTVHQFISGSHLSLLVKNSDDDIVGVLTLSDVAGAIFAVMRDIEKRQE